MGLTIERWIAILFMIILYTDICIGQTTLLPEIVPFENEAWILICKANTFASTVSIGDPSGSTIGFCIPAAASCSANAGYALAINVTENTVTMTRTLTNNDNGTWTCSHTGGSANYVLQSPLLSRNVAQSKTDYFDKAMTASPGIEIDTTDPDYTFTFHYGCISTNLKFKWTIVPGVPWDDTSNTASTDLTCNTNQAFKSTQLTSVILPKVTQDGSKLKVSVYVDGYDNIQAVEEYTFNVTFSASSKSPDSPKSDTTFIVVGVVSGIVVLAIFGLMIYFKVYKRKVQKTPVVKSTQLVPPVQKTPVVKSTQLVPSVQKIPVVTDTQLVPSVPKTPVVTGMPLEPEGPLKIKTRQDHVEFKWKPPKSDGGSKITEYIVEVNGIKFDTWETFVKSSSMKLKVPMEKFKDGKVMSFRVRAENEYGLSEPLSAQKPFTLQNSHDLLANRPVVTNQGRGHDGFLPRNSVGTEHKRSSLLEQVPIDRTLPKLV